uniref:Cilia- and flagella-associated protein 43 n=1 Tax=Albugo laibachii Nc14 TaxID=890382 RepID=F0WPU3_9STRA|nr:conserved hypothetical protein [Albugo laibachii Nc14]|eukprot:CCA23344.1 conserved hypothetical protein [Albugo laibachii Nc14]
MSQILIGTEEELELWYFYLEDASCTHVRKKIQIPHANERHYDYLEEMGLNKCGLRAISQCWLSEKDVLLGNQAGQLFLVDLSRPEAQPVLIPAVTRVEKCSIISIVQTNSTIVLTFTDGVLYWIRLSDYQIQHEANIFNENGDAESERFTSTIVSVAPSPDKTVLCIGTNRGQILTVKTNPPTKEIEDDEVVVEFTGTEDTNVPDSTLVLNELIIARGSFHTGAICSATVLTPSGRSCNENIICVTGGENGNLHLWDISTGRVLHGVHLESLHGSYTSAANATDEHGENASTFSKTYQAVITALQSHITDPIIIVGDSMGILRVVYATMAIELTHNGSKSTQLELLHSVKLFNTLIDLIQMHHIEPFSLIASTCSDIIYVLSLENRNEFEVVAFWKVPSGSPSHVDNDLCMDVRWILPEHLNDLSFAFICLTMQGRIYKVCYVPQAANSSDPSSFRTAESPDLLMQCCPIQLREELVGSNYSNSQHDVTSTKKNCTILQSMIVAPPGIMLSITPYRNDLMLRQFPTEGRDANTSTSTENVLPEMRENNQKVLVRDAHENGVTAIACCQTKFLEIGQELVATGCINGTISLWTLSNLCMGKAGKTFQACTLDDFKIVKRKTISAHAGAVTTLTFVSIDEGLRLISTGSDGIVMIMHANITNINEENSQRPQAGTTPLYHLRDFATMGSEKVYDDEGNEIPKEVPTTWSSMNECFTDRLHKQLELNMQRRIDPTKVETRICLNKLKTRLKSLVDENQSYLEQEQLEIDELVVNLERKMRISAETGAKFQQIFENITNKIARTIIIRKRMKKEFWDPNTVQGNLVGCLLPRSTVARLSDASLKFSEPSPIQNIPIRKLAKEEETLFRKIYLLRLIELEHCKYEDERNGSKHVLEDDENTASLPIKMKDSRSIGFRICFNSILPRSIQWLVNGGVHHPLSSRWIGAISATKHNPDFCVKDKEKQFAALVPDNLTMTELDPVFLSGSNGETYRQDVTAYELGETRRALNVTTSFILMYHPIAMRTSRQNRLQISLLQQYERFLCSTYNDTFDILQKERSSRMGLIEQKIEQLNDIAQELGIARHELALIDNSDNEDLASTFHSSFIINKKESQSQLLKNTTTNKGERVESRMISRALLEMMDGTLEMKKETILSQQSIVKEPWMLEILPEEMTPDQRKQAIAVEASQQKLAEEQEKYRKLLDSETRKLRVEILEISKDFDERLKNMQDLHSSIQRLALVQGLYALSLLGRIMTRENLAKAISDVNEQLVSTDRSVEKAKYHVDEFARHIVKCREHIVRATDEDKALERSFKKDLENLVVFSPSTAATANAQIIPIDHDQLKVLLTLYKKRKADTTSGNRRELKTNSGEVQLGTISNEKGKVGRIGASSTTERKKKSVVLSNSDILHKNSKCDIQRCDNKSVTGSEIVADSGSRDIMEQSGKELKKVNSISIIPLSHEIDCPSGVNVPDRIWKALNELRTKKILSEIHLKQRSDQYAAAKSVGEDLHVILQNVLIECDLQRKSQEKQQKSLDQLNKETPILLHLKQGQHETGFDNCVSQPASDNILMETRGHIVELQNAMLVDRQSVVALNKAIRLHGIDQVQILSRIRNFRKSINQMEWEHHLLKFQKHDTEEKYIDFQLLRVTKELHEVIQNGSTTTKQKREVLQLEAKLSHIGKHQQHSQTKQNKQDQKLVSQLQDLENENAKFGAQIEQAEVQVQIRCNILQSRQHVLHNNSESRSPLGEDLTKLKPSIQMKAIQVRRKLIELTKSQTIEIDHLRNELKKMRRKTFPAFEEHRRDDFLPDHN